jgi:hypothetical protein
MWYVACTRARDLLIIPELPAASSQSWSKILNLGHHALPKLNLAHLREPALIAHAAVVNEQTIERFAREAQRMATAALTLTWLRPSEYDHDRGDALEPATRSIDDAFEYVQPVGAGRLRGVLLHKLMEELLTGELMDVEATAMETRATQLLEELLGREEAQPDAPPDAGEIARTALKTLTLAAVATLRPLLIPEIAVWSSSPDGPLLAGRADALAVKDGNVVAALDWKSDVAPTREERLEHIGQLSEYLTATGAPRGALIYMSLGEVVWVEAKTRALSTASTSGRGTGLLV